MKKIHVIIIGLLFVIVAAFSNRHFATTWAGTASNQMVTRQALNDAVTNGVFTAKQSFPSDSRVVTKSMAQQYVNINTISGYDMNQLVPKSVFVSATPFYAHTLTGPFWGDGWDGYSSSTNALAAAPGGSPNNFDVYSLYNRPLAVGDEIFYSASTSSYPGIPRNSGTVSGGPYYWFYYPALNAAVEVTNTLSARQYILQIVYPPSLTNVIICLEITYDASNQVTIRATSSTAVDTNVDVSWSYSINGGSITAGSTFTINSGFSGSGYSTIVHSGTISSFDITINSFSPTSSSTQNYVSGGACS